MPALVTPVMIVRDEERALPGALESLPETGGTFAAPCVYDTGSTDGTQGLAAARGAVVTQGFWDDDFARARNSAAEMAGTPWVLVMDADERLEVAVPLLKRAIARADDQGLDSLIIEVDDERGGAVVGTAPSIRFFRPAEVHYRNRIHEVLVRRDGQKCRSARLPREVAHLRHVGYGPADSMDRRRVRNSRIGDLEVEAARAQGDDAVRLVEALVNRGRSRSIGDNWAAGIPDWEEARSLVADTPFRLLAGELLARAYIEAGHPAKAGAVLRDMVTEGSDRHLVAWLTARGLADTGRHAAAVHALRGAEAPTSALGERYAVAPVLQTRMLAAAEVGETDVALDDAITLMAGHGVFGFARLCLLLWGERPVDELAARLTAAGTAHLGQLAEEFSAVDGRGPAVAEALRRCGSD